MSENTQNSQPASLDFENIDPYHPRHFLQADAALDQKEAVLSFYQTLLDRTIQSGEDLESLIMDRSELEAAIDQIKSILYIRMTCQTDDPARAQAYKAFIETIAPAVKPLSDQLDKKIIQSVDTLGFNKPYYEVYFQKMRADIELFREENVSLQTEDDLLSQNYQTVTGAMTVQFQGQELPISKIRKYFYETDRTTRELAWKAFMERYFQDRDALDKIFDQMVSIRHQIALHSGFENYRDYKFREYHRFDYTPDHCRQFHDAVEKHVVPILRKMHQLRAEQMKLTTLRPWDLSCDPLGREPLKPAENPEEFVEKLHVLFSKVNPVFGSQFKMMIDYKLFDLESRKGKAPGGYQASLNESRKPFIFGNTIGTDSDLNLMTHEGGHAFHLLACVDERLNAYLHAPTEFCEVASMSMELLSSLHLDVFYSGDAQKQWRRDNLEGIVRSLTRIALFDAFQHWLYENPSHTRIQRQNQWIKLNDRFSSDVENWTGIEDFRASYWHIVLHLFQFPFYYIEYGIAQLGALGIWLQSKQNAAQAIANYQKALALGGSKPLPELFEAAGLEFDFSEKTIQPLADVLLKEWQLSVE